MKPDDSIRRQELLSSAARLFRDVGYPRATVRDIAKAVGIQSGSIFYYFKTKEDILVDVMEAAMQTFVGAAQRALREVEMLRGCLNVPVFTYDERLTTVTAERSLDQLNMTGRNRRAVVDAVAASVILQGWLDRRAHLALTEQGSFDAERSR